MVFKNFNFWVITTLLSCNMHLKNKVIVDACNNKMPSIELLECASYYIPRLNEYDNRINDSLTIDKLLSTLSVEAHKGDKNAQYLLLSYFKNKTEYLIKKNINPVTFGDYYLHEEARSFSKLRGKEAFELALRCAAKTECVFYGDDMAGVGGNLGLNMIEYIINPMIKSVGGEFDMSMYLYVDNYKNRSVKPTSSDPCQRAHEFTYGELIKAYNEGKIVLKKYGEDD